MLQRLLQAGTIHTSDSLLAVCAEDGEAKLFRALGFQSVTLANLGIYGSSLENPYPKVVEDTMNLSFADRSFEICFVSDGLHHCSSPHRALLEMYRVARKAVIVFESRDSLVMRLATRFRLSPEYELEAVVDNKTFGGVDNTEVPNFIYRWTEAEFQKTIQSFDPTGKQQFQFFYGLNLPHESAKNHPVKRLLLLCGGPILKWITKLAKRQSNSFAMIALRPKLPDDHWPWLKAQESGFAFDHVYAAKLFPRKYAEGQQP